MKNIIEEIKNAGDKYIFSPSITVDKNELIQIIKDIFEYENKNEVIPEIVINLKGLPIDTIIHVMKYCFECESIRNSSILMNMFAIISGYNSLDEQFFNDERIYISSLEEYLEIKMNCKNELKKFATNLTKYFLSCIKSSSKLEYTYLDDVIEIPTTYERILRNSTILQLSSIMQKAEPINTDDLFVISNATVYVNSIALHSAMSYKMLEQMYGNNE